jgi:hypothetical protein
MPPANELPRDIKQIIDYLWDHARIQRGELPPYEKDKLKGNLMAEPGRWRSGRVSVAAFRSRCLDVGFSTGDTDLMVDLLRKAQSGRRMRPSSRFYRGFKFSFPYE